MFKAMNRLCDKGSDNSVINIDRLCMHAALAAPMCFPHVVQQSVTRDDLERHRNQPALGPRLRLDRDRSGLAVKSFRLDGPAEIPKPLLGAKTCSAPAHSQQVGFEEALLHCGISRTGQLTKTEFLTRSWPCDLLDVVKHTAVSVLHPTVLLDIESDEPYLVTLASARCLWGWPLQLLFVEHRVLVQNANISELTVLVVTSLFLGRPLGVSETHRQRMMGQVARNIWWRATAPYHDEGILTVASWISRLKLHV